MNGRGESDPFAVLIGRLHADGKLPDDPRELAARLCVELPPLTHHQITVSRVIDGYREKLHDFAALDEAPPARWIYVPAPSMKQMREFAHQVHSQATALPHRRLESIDPTEWRADPKAAYLRTARNLAPAVDFDELLPSPRRRVPVETWIVAGDRVSLAADFQPPARIFTPILDALFSGGRPEVDMDELKDVVRELVGQLNRLANHMAGHGDRELYSMILQRCSILG